MNNILYLECYAGISGDMAVAALLDLGADQKVLAAALQSLPLDGFHTEIRQVKKSGLDVCDFNVILTAEHENHDHDMDYLYAAAPSAADCAHGAHGRHGHAHMHEHGAHGHHGHMQEQEHRHEHASSAPHAHRGLAEIREIIRRTEMTEHAKALADRIFMILAEAEAAAHGTTVDQVHFHEVGAVDSIVDIVSAAVCLDNLKIIAAVVAELYEGRGFVRCRHGMIPIPVPAVANIAAAHGLRLHITEDNGEFITPTGAAIVAAIKTADRLPEGFTITKTGMGAGKRTYERPNILRAMLIQRDTASDTICKLESNIDDCSGEILGFVMEKLLAAGARDVYYTPILMKKNRPAYQINVICNESERNVLEQILFMETTTIGIRRLQMERTVLEREIQTLATPLGEANVKICAGAFGRRVYPEYDSVCRLCREHHLPYREVYRQIQAAGENNLKKEP